ncbi:probable ATP-dependent RNA helicase DHX34 [Nephila pilipes]|uniref:Probable ATP-dependent RNA helicase DHX34 n=1 Tax=Nephila pilipes TaxID=299642 RepID=A0A8X6NHA6_NEPPI|nr:probable ATP-dependent RNA helicase DHX34 [Nephila pilipes]
MGKHKKKRHRSEHNSPDHKKSSFSNSYYNADDDYRNIRNREKKSKTEEIVKNSDATDEILKSSSSNQVYLKDISPDFSWTDYRSTLNKIFFHDRGKIKRNTSQYDEFWIFLKKYQEVQQKAAIKKLQESDGTSNQTKPKVNFYLDSEELNNMMMRGHLFRDDAESPLCQDRLVEFAYIIELYLNCIKKQEETKLKKLREAQENLPISKYRTEILRAVENNQIILVAGDTGCGKSTQVPQYLMAAGYDSIACTQPRRIACISLCKRVAYETQNEYKSEIGYQIRFEKSKTQHTKILFLTEGLLLRQVSSDPMLSMYKVVILDEVHERHLSCDFLLGIMKCLTVQRPDLKILLMSATINIELFSDYFNNCPVIQVPGRLFPIQVKYCPVSSEERKSSTGKLNPVPYIHVLNIIDQKYPEDERGDVLIFLSGMTEISIVEEAAKAYAEKSSKWIILPLHSTLSIEDQDKVFDIAPEGVRKCIISTNVAETSITIDGVRFVVDSGKVKEMSYHPVCHMQRLQEFWISKASAEQRKGRAGRTGPGVCFRLYSQKEYDDLAAYTKPEIQRVPLDSLLLQLLSMGLPNARKFPFLEPPDPSSIEESLQNLKSQGALTDEEELTPMGSMLSKLPVDITIGKMLIHGCMFSVIEPMLSLAAALSVQSPFTNRSVRDPEMRASRQSFESDHGDPFTLLNAFHKWLEVKVERQNSRKWCRRKGLEEQRFYEMTKLRRQFKELLKDSGILPEDFIHTSSQQRSNRHGEISHLRDMKRQFHQAPRKRKVLRLESDHFYNEDEDSDDGRIDIHDIDFWISNNSWQVQLLSSKSQVSSYRDMVCLKFIVCNALYPRFAIADVHNTYNNSTDQHFHTKAIANVMEEISVKKEQDIDEDDCTLPDLPETQLGLERRNLDELFTNFSEENRCSEYIKSINKSLTSSSDSEDDVEEEISEEDVDEDDPTYPGPSQISNVTWVKKQELDKLIPNFSEEQGPSDDITSIKFPAPIDIFLSIITVTFIEKIVLQTNLYASQSGKKFSAVSLEEMLVFLAINLVMGIKHMPSYRDFWSTDEILHDEYVSKQMPVKRFSWILGHLHMNDKSLQPKKGEANFDKLFKLRPLLTHLSERFTSVYKPGQNQAIDEAIIEFKESGLLKQYKPKGRINNEFKVCMRCDDGGYVCQFEIYTGKAKEAVKKNLGEKVAMTLTSSLYGKNHRVYMNNFFTSYELFRFLETKNVFCCGEVNLNQKDLPKNLKDDKNLNRGDFDWAISSDGLTCLKWKDKSCVSILSSLGDSVEIAQVQRRQRNGDKIQLICPKAVKDYYKNMGFVAYFNQMKCLYQIDRKSMKWWHRIFFHFLDVAVVNSYIIYQMLPVSQLELKTLKVFRIDIIRSLMMMGRLEVIPKRKFSDPPILIKKHKPHVPVEKRLKNVGHFAIKCKPRRCAYCSTAKKPHTTRWMCETCNGKPFVVLHPNGTLALQPEYLQLKETDIIEIKNLRTTTPFSKKHQIVSFLSLLETTKPFLVNCLRVPAAHTLLLCCHSLDTNQDFTRTVCDGWIELRFPETESIQDFVYQAFNIRDSWQKLLQKAFEEFTMDKEAKIEEIHKMGKRIFELISGFFHTEIIHSVRRLLAADVKNLYIGPQGGDVPVAVGLLDDAQTAQENTVKGGLQIKPYLTYNCLVDLEDKYLQYIQKHWTCLSCGKEMVATILDQIRHKETCEGQNEKSIDVPEETNKGPPKKSYFCQACQKEFLLTLPDILRHKRSHSSSSS